MQGSGALSALPSWLSCSTMGFGMLLDKFKSVNSRCIMGRNAAVFASNGCLAPADFAVLGGLGIHLLFLSAW